MKRALQPSLNLVGTMVGRGAGWFGASEFWVMAVIADTIEDVGVEVEVVLGETRMPVHQLLRMGRGAVIELPTREDDDVVVLANDVPVAKASVMVEDGKIHVAITRILARSPRLRD